MEKRILLEKRGRPDNEITELILDNCRSTYIDGLTDSFTALETLSLINVGLVSLKNFPKLSNLRKLELSDNRISNGLNHLTGSPKLTHLNLSGNRIKDFDELQPLKELENLEVLDLFNNQVTLIDSYREKLFQLIPSLNYLDGFDKQYVEAPSDEEEMADNDNQQQPSQFSINGIEIDLDELEQLESRIREKRLREDTKKQSIKGPIMEEHPNTASSSVGSVSSSTSPDYAKYEKDDLDMLYEEIQRKQALQKENEEEQKRKKAASFLAVLIMFASLLAFINQICFRGEQQSLDEMNGFEREEEDEDGDEEDGEGNKDRANDESGSMGDAGTRDLKMEIEGNVNSDTSFPPTSGSGVDNQEEEAEDSCEESDEVSLAYLYNDNLEEDQEDWKSVEGDYNNGDDEFDSEDEEEEAGDNDGEEDDDSDGEDVEGEDEEDGEDDGDQAAEGADAATSGADAKSAPVVATAATTTSATEEAASAGDEEEAVAKASESEARGKKRKFEGTDSDG
ncbi:acidic leucine-rich nuclear phosphoprotein 32 family member A [Anopheles nili]|uniref:acidic leucine-rich nuclear phosphoprotein 32 family member A n=1 Tax=Anopheles nili TaxID=185578 RepID=UPI00237B6BD8|nr:acidic leucine-rich nuclear phosphoprotein 32 family member A [Anopheles nili]